MCRKEEEEKNPIHEHLKGILKELQTITHKIEEKVS